MNFNLDEVFNDKAKFSKILNLLAEDVIRNVYDDLSNARITQTLLNKLDTYFIYQGNLGAHFSDKRLEKLYLKFNNRFVKLYTFINDNFVLEYSNTLGLYLEHRHGRKKIFGEDKSKLQSWWDMFSELKDLKRHLVTDYATLLEVGYKKFGKKNKDSISIFFDKETGNGQTNGQDFKLKKTTAEYRIFSELFDHINTSVSRLKVLTLAHVYEEEESLEVERHSSDTQIITKLSKSLRIKAKLTIKTLVQNDGTLTLVGEKD